MPLEISSLSRMPKRGSVFRGEINDLSRSERDRTGWQPREIIFYKKELRSKELNLYPVAGDKILLDDQLGGLFECKFSKPQTKEHVCLGTPQQLKPWYKKKGYNDEFVRQVNRDGGRDTIYFQYTGDGLRFYIYTESEFNVEQILRRTLDSEDK